MRSLIDHGADLNAICQDLDDEGKDVRWTPLHVASWNGMTSVLRILLEYGVDPDAPDNYGRTALHLAPYGGGTTDVELLLEYGADVDAEEGRGWTPLHKAAYHLNLQAVAVLLNCGADPLAQTYKGETPIQLANEPYPWDLSKEDQAQIIRLLSVGTSERM